MTLPLQQRHESSAQADSGQRKQEAGHSSQKSKTGVLSSSTGKTQHAAHEEAVVSPFKTVGESIRRTSKPVPPKNKAS